MFSRLNLFRLWIAVITLFGYNERVSSQVFSSDKDSLIVNCCKIEPVYNDSKSESPKDFEFTKETLDNFLNKTLGINKMPPADYKMDFVTNFGYQKEIIVNYDCFNRLTKPNTCNLINLYFNIHSSTWIKKKSVVEFIKKYKKSIYNYGKVNVFEYRFNNVAENEPHFMFIIIKEPSDSELRLRKDYIGYAICSDGMDWKDSANRQFSTPLFIQMVRRSKEFYIPLYYDKRRFIPIGHFKSKNWGD